MPYRQQGLIGSRSIWEYKSIKNVHRKEHFYVQEMTSGLIDDNLEALKGKRNDSAPLIWQLVTGRSR